MASLAGILNAAPKCHSSSLDFTLLSTDHFGHSIASRLEMPSLYIADMESLSIRKVADAKGATKEVSLWFTISIPSA